MKYKKGICFEKLSVTIKHWNSPEKALASIITYFNVLFKCFCPCLLMPLEKLIKLQKLSFYISAPLSLVSADMQPKCRGEYPSQKYLRDPLHRAFSQQ